MPTYNSGPEYYNAVVQDYSNFQYRLPESYIYLYHTDEFFIIPQYPEHIADSMQTSFGEQNALSRTAPVFSYNNSVPRTVQVSIRVHRDMMNDVNTSHSNVYFNRGSDIVYNIDDDYIDVLIKKLQSIALPVYDASSKLVKPPMVAVRFGNEVFIKGVVTGGISVDFEAPILENKKYAIISVQFTVTEVQPYDANQVGALGSFRGLTSGLAAKMDPVALYMKRSQNAARLDGGVRRR